MKKGKKFYVVKVGRIPGIYKTWNECKIQVDGFPKAIYKSFSNISAAQDFLAGKNLNPLEDLLINLTNQIKILDKLGYKSIANDIFNIQQNIINKKYKV